MKVIKMSGELVEYEIYGRKQLIPKEIAELMEKLRKGEILGFVVNWAKREITIYEK